MQVTARRTTLESTSAQEGKKKVGVHRPDKYHTLLRVSAMPWRTIGKPVRFTSPCTSF